LLQTLPDGVNKIQFIKGTGLNDQLPFQVLADVERIHLRQFWPVTSRQGRQGKRFSTATLVCGMSHSQQNDSTARKPPRKSIRTFSGQSSQQKRRDEALQRQQAARRDLGHHARKLATLAANAPSRVDQEVDQASTQEQSHRVGEASQGVSLRIATESLCDLLLVYVGCVKF